MKHATQPCAEGLTGPVDVYDTLAGLGLLATRLPQALTQVRRFLARERAVGRVLIVGAPHAGDPGPVVTATACELEQATSAAGSLHEDLAHVHELLRGPLTHPLGY